jgi:UDP-glucose 4-epimerase
MVKKAVITGGAGFIGTHLAEGLKKEGYDVGIIDLKQGSDVRDLKNLKQAFVGASLVFHLAAQPRVQYSIEHPAETDAINVGGTVAVLEAAKEAGVKRIVFSSSSAVYGEQKEMPLKETMSVHPMSPYALQKYIGELYCKLFSEMYEVSTVCLRYFNVYGHGADPQGPYALVVAKFLDQRIKNEPMTITGDGTQTRDFVHVQDVLRANILAATSERVGRGEVINIGSGSSASVNDIAQLIGGPTKNIEPRLEPHDTLADISCARELLGWEPQISLTEGIAELKKLHNLL